jgi:hypothetical protein
MAKTTLLERLEWLSETHGGRELCRRVVEMGLGSMSENTLSNAIGRLKNNEELDVGYNTLHKWAAAAPVSPAWLLAGIGNPDGVASSDSQYPSRDAVVAALTELGDLAVAAALQKAHYSGVDGDPGEAYWWEEAKKIRRRIREYQSET